MNHRNGFRIVLAGLSLLILAGASQPTEHRTKHPDERDANANPDNAPPLYEPAYLFPIQAVQPIPTIVFLNAQVFHYEEESKAEDGQPGEQSAQHDPEGIKWTDKAVAIFTIVLGIAAIISGFIAYCQWRMLIRQDVRLKESIAATQTAADAARLSADTALGVELPLFTISRLNFVEGNATYAIGFTNRGRTAAIMIRACLTFKIAHSLDLPPRYPSSNTMKIPADEIVEQNGSFSIARRQGISPGEWNDIYSGKNVIWVYGYFVYSDFRKINRIEGFCLGGIPVRAGIAARLYEGTLADKLEWYREGPSAYTYSRQYEEKTIQG